MNVYFNYILFIINKKHELFGGETETTHFFAQPLYEQLELSLIQYSFIDSQVYSLIAIFFVSK